MLLWLTCSPVVAGGENGPTAAVVHAAWECIAEADKLCEQEALVVAIGAQCFAHLGPSLRVSVAGQIQSVCASTPQRAGRFMDLLLGALSDKAAAQTEGVSCAPVFSGARWRTAIKGEMV